MDKFQLGQEVTLQIHDLGINGEGIGQLNGYTVFVSGSLPGETVLARFFQCQKKYGKASLVKVLAASPDRVTPPCVLFGRCGGCQLMHLSYEKQLEAKWKRVKTSMDHHGVEYTIAPCISSPFPLSYRNKVQFPARKGKQGLELGLYEAFSNRIVDIATCPVHSAIGEKVYQEVRKVIKRARISPYDPITQEGELKHLLIKSAVHTKEALVVLVTCKDPSEELLLAAKEIMSAHPFIKGVVLNINAEKNNTVLGKEYLLLEGTSRIKERLCGLEFTISAASFFQVNPFQAEHLYAKALEFAKLTGEETVLDAYCGVGTLSLVFAKQAKHVVGVECIYEAIEDAKDNAARNGIDNVSFICSTAEKYILEHAQVDVAILNPPRKGCERVVLEALTKNAVKRIVYVSCDPDSLARDLSFFKEKGYQIEAIQPFDMFPQTAHVECVARLSYVPKP